MQYWKGENVVKESQPYQVDENKCKPGPSRKLTTTTTTNNNNNS